MAGLLKGTISRPAVAPIVAVAFLMSFYGSLPAQGKESPASDAELPKIPIELYVSGKDADTPAIRSAVAKVIQKFPRYQLREIDIDTEAGRTEREQMEKTHGIRDPGEATLCIGPYHLVNRADDLEIQKYFPYFAARILSPKAGHGRLEPDVLPFAREIFGKDVEVKLLELPDLEGQRVFSVEQGGKTVGVVGDMYRATRCPYCNDTQFLVALKPDDYAIRAIKSLRPIERYGKPVEDKVSGKFLKGFMERKPATDSELHIDAVVEATRTSGAYRIAIQELWKALQRKK